MVVIFKKKSDTVIPWFLYLYFQSPRRQLIYIYFHEAKQAKRERGTRKYIFGQWPYIANSIKSMQPDCWNRTSACSIHVQGTMLLKEMHIAASGSLKYFIPQIIPTNIFIHINFKFQTSWCNFFKLEMQVHLQIFRDLCEV